MGASGRALQRGQNPRIAPPPQMEPTSQFPQNSLGLLQAISLLPSYLACEWHLGWEMGFSPSSALPCSAPAWSQSYFSLEIASGELLHVHLVTAHHLDSHWHQSYYRSVFYLCRLITAWEAQQWGCSAVKSWTLHYRIIEDVLSISICRFLPDEW